MSGESRGVYFVPNVAPIGASYRANGRDKKCPVAEGWIYGQKGDDICPVCGSRNVDPRRALDGNPAHVCMQCNICWAVGAQVNICGLWHTD